MEKLVKKYRRALHEIPELDFHLYETKKYLLNVLKDLDFKLFYTATTGIIAYKKGKINKSIAFRADMDALPINESTNVSYQSKHEGLMHACGHDAHMSMLLGFANLINNKELLNKGIVLIFQPAEETMGGAKVIMDEGILETLNVEKIFGIHVYPNLKEGLIGITNGVMMASSAFFEIVVNGTQAHGALPHQGNDAIIATSNLINQIQTIISRKIDPIDNAVISIGTINGGNAANVIADKVVIKGTIRTFTKAVFETIEKEINKIAGGISQSFNVEINVKIEKMYPVVNNDEKLYSNIKEVLTKFNYEILKPMTTSEDFSFYQEKIPGLFMMLGTKNVAKGFVYPLHNSKFNLDEDVLIKGVDLYNAIAKYYNLY